MSKKKLESLAPGKLPKLWPLLVEMYQNDPTAFSSPDFLRAKVAQRWKLLDQKQICPNCLASMSQYSPRIDFYDALLLKAMSDVVRSNLRGGKSFTEANQVHVQSMDGADYTTKSRTTKCRQLGLIAKVMVDGVHDQAAGWVITTRGWQFLRNEPVPRQVTTFRNEIVERSDETTTIIELLNNEDRHVAYDPQSWVVRGDVIESVL